MPARPSREAPVVLIHGGGHAKWSFEQYAQVLSEGGYEVHALDWFNHGDSRRLPEDQFLRRGVDDVAHDELRYINALVEVEVEEQFSQAGLPVSLDVLMHLLQRAEQGPRPKARRLV